ncbi:hypothetical protein KY285_022953 [Solanum tuberosum]|nr:hypothetical protein KY285_022953 [Solanum tuberosum]
MDEVMLPGFRFHPTDEELVGFYLRRKVQQKPISIELIKQLDIYKYDPWDLPKLAAVGEKEWYFYCPRDRKYRNSARPNRVTGAGFWKATGTDRPIYSSEGSKCIGLKKSLVFYKGRAAKGIKTDWMMHEFRLPSITDSTAPKRFLDKHIPPNDSWAICRIFKKANSNAHRALSHSWVSPPQVLPQNNTTSHDFLTNYSIALPENIEGGGGGVHDDTTTTTLKEANNVIINNMEHMEELQWGNVVRSNNIGVIPLMNNFPLNMAADAWKTNLLWDSSSPCPSSEMSTSYSTNKCYT